MIAAGLWKRGRRDGRDGIPSNACTRLSIEQISSSRPVPFVPLDNLYNNLADPCSEQPEAVVLTNRRQLAWAKQEIVTFVHIPYRDCC
jgi:hypothetical protein